MKWGFLCAILCAGWSEWQDLNLRPHRPERLLRCVRSPQRLALFANGSRLEKVDFVVSVRKLCAVHVSTYSQFTPLYEDFDIQCAFRPEPLPFSPL